MKKWLLVLCLILPSVAFGQNYAVPTSTVVDGTGHPVAGATVTVCSGSLALPPSGTVCSPATTIFSSFAGASKANPFTTDGFGNWPFFAPSGNYLVSISGGPLIAYSFYVSVGASSGVTSLTATLPLVATPSPISGTGAYSCPTCIFGSVASTQIPYANGANSVVGSPDLIYDVAGGRFLASLDGSVGTTQMYLVPNASPGNPVAWMGIALGNQIYVTSNGVNIAGSQVVLGSGAGFFNWIFDDSTGCEKFGGSTSGSASICVPAVAGTPNKINLPTASGLAGQFLTTDGNNPQQASWTTPTALSCSYQSPAGAVTGTGAAATYFTCSVPALASGTGISITAVSKHTTGTAAVTYTVSFGGTSTTSSAPAGSANQVEVIKCLLMNNVGSTTAQTVTTQYMDSNSGTISTKLDTMAINTAGAQTLNVQFNVANTDAITPEMFLVQLVR